MNLSKAILDLAPCPACHLRVSSSARARIPPARPRLRSSPSSEAVGRQELPPRGREGKAAALRPAAAASPSAPAEVVPADSDTPRARAKRPPRQPRSHPALPRPGLRGEAGGCTDTPAACAALTSPTWHLFKYLSITVCK